MRCKKCGRWLSNPESIARGMGPECAGIRGSGRRRVIRAQSKRRGSAYNAIGPGNRTTMPLFSLLEEPEVEIHPQLKEYPAELINLVLFAQKAGAIAMRVKKYEQPQSIQVSPGLAIKEIRQICLNLHIKFFAGISQKDVPLACIPVGEDRWKIGEEGREISKESLYAFLYQHKLVLDQR